MVSVLRRITLIAVALLAVTTSVEAQRFGPQVSWGSESDLGVGVRGEFNLAGKLSQTGPFSQAFVIAAFDYFFIDCDPAECTYWELNPSLAIPIGPTERNMYVGAGLNYTSFTSSFGGFDFSDTNTGLNVLGGMKFSLGSLPAFAEARFSLGGGEQLVLSFGMLFGGNP